MPAEETASVAVPDWPRDRWLKILDRIEHRQPNVGLRYWGPPVWLEVTMAGPDADLWPANTDHSLSWDWQSSAPCVEAEDLVVRGADDDCLVAVVGRYTIENLMLNAVHEIGEWFRFDGCRLFPAHTSGSARPGGQDPQGNGTVALQVNFEHASEPHGGAVIGPRPEEESGQRFVTRMERGAAASRFTYLPGTTISYEAPGPVIRSWEAGKAVTTWRSTWSTSTIEADDATAVEMRASAARDVHHALVLYESDRICRAFHIDGRRAWRLAGPTPPLGAEAPDSDAPGVEALSVSTRYTLTSLELDQGTVRPDDDADLGRFALVTVGEDTRQ